MRIPYALAATRIFGTPLLMHPEKARQVADVLNNRQRQKAGWFGDDDDADQPETVVTSAAIEVRAAGEGQIYRVIEGAAIIPVSGSLAHKTGDLHPSSGITGYDGVTAKLRVAMQDPNVRGIWLDIDSPGGEVSGCFDLADEIRASRAASGGKPIWASADEAAYSAAYALASQADVLIAPRTAGVGSVGVVMMHADYSGMLDEAGIKVTLIHAGAHKVDGNPYEALGEDTYKAWMAECEATRALFAATVSAGRGITADAVLATEARCYGAAEAKKLGLIDSVSSATAGFAVFVDHLRGR